MGLFSKKQPCPICGEKIPFFLPTKIEGEYICNDCSDKIDMDDEIKSRLTIKQLREYFVFYEQNQKLKDEFIVSQKLDFGCFDTKMIFDFENKLFCMSKNPDKTIFSGTQLKGFIIKEDSFPIFEGSSVGLKRYASTVPQRIIELAPQINMMLMTQRIADNIERLNYDENDKRQYRPRMDISEPFNQFYVELYLNHPYWKTIRCDMSAPTFYDQRPDINDYMDEYRRDVDVMYELAKALMNVAFPESDEIFVASALSASAPLETSVTSGDMIEEIKKYKALVESGIITKEEFDLKKRMILGI